MTLEQFEAMVEAQKGRCALCGSDEPAGSKDQWHIDHDHSCCGKDRSCASCRRGLLCNRCNQELGVIEKHRFRMNEVFAYLDRKAGSTDTI